MENCELDFTNKSVYLRHLGVTHELVLLFMEPAEEVTEGQADDNSPIENNEMVKTTENSQTEVLGPPVVNKEEDIVKNQEVKEVVASAVGAGTDQSPRTPVEAVAVMDVASVQCFPCQENNKTRIFEKKSEFLKHLSLIHYGKQILQNYPYREGEKCDLCYDSAKKVYIPNKKELYVCHVSIIHQKLFELIPPEIDRQIKDMPSIKKQESGIKPPLSSSTTIPCKYCNEHVPRKEMKEHLLHHKAVISQKQSANESEHNIVNLKMNKN